MSSPAPVRLADVALIASLGFLGCDEPTEPDPIFFTLTASVTGEGTLHSSPQGIICGNDCAENYGEERIVTLAAIPETGWHLAAWGGACADTAPTISCTVSMTGDRHVTATFEPGP